MIITLQTKETSGLPLNTEHCHGPTVIMFYRCKFNTHSVTANDIILNVFSCKLDFILKANFNIFNIFIRSYKDFIYRTSNVVLVTQVKGFIFVKG